MFVGLLFYIPEQDERRIGNSEFSAPSGGRNLELVIIVIIIIAAPLPWPPPHDFQKPFQIYHFLWREFCSCVVAPLQTRFKVHNDILMLLHPSA